MRVGPHNAVGQGDCIHARPNGAELRALQRITRSLCAGMDDESGEVRYKGEEFFMCKYRIARAPTMMQWRMSDEAQAGSPAAQ